MHKDMNKALLEDEKYKQLLEAAQSEEEREQIKNFMTNLMSYFQANIFDPLKEKANDPEFIEALSKKSDKLIRNNSGE